MIPIQALLQRIRWDTEFGRGEFLVGYFDRTRHGLVSVPLASLRFRAGDHFAFSAIEADGSVHEVPFHRVREVRRDGELIWQRHVADDERR
jgi:uncharacterized protein (UPF0248 family)